MFRDYVGDLFIISFMILSISLSVLLLSNLKSLNNDNKNCEICCCNFNQKSSNLHNQK